MRVSSLTCAITSPRGHPQGVCEKTVQDVVERFWDIIEDININKVQYLLSIVPLIYTS